MGDNDSNLKGTLLSSRYSGEYIKFGNDENNLYRIVSHEVPELTKITSAKVLTVKGVFSRYLFGNNNVFSSANTIGTFLNGDYLTKYVDNEYRNMVEDNTTFFLGMVNDGDSYKLAKYTDISSDTFTTNTLSKVGLLRYGELMAGQFDRYAVKGGSDRTDLTTDYWLLTPYNSHVRDVYAAGGSSGIIAANDLSSVKPTLNLKSNVIITSGEGTKNNPFTLELP